MPDFELILLLLVVVATIVAIAHWVGIAYPILLVIGGIGLGLLPGVPSVQLDPELVLVVFLPPLIFAAAWQTPIRDVRENLQPVLLLSVGLVLFTTAVVGVVVAGVLPGLPLAAAFALGAIVSPSDVLAATTVLSRIAVPRRVRAILEEESLVNDATALTVYRTAVAAAVSGTFVAADAIGTFALASVGGIAVGLVVAYVADQLWRRLFDPPVEVSLSLVLPYAAYLPAEHLGASGVIAAATAGLWLGYRSSRILGPDTRLVANSVWEILTFVLNGFAFLLVGLELPTILRGIAGRSGTDLIVDAAAVSLAVVVSRFVWVYGSLVLPKSIARLRRRPGGKPMTSAIPLIVSWAGMRGAVSLAAALALPTGFPERNLILFLAFAVIGVTLLGQGLTFPAILSRIRVPPDGDELEEETLARTTAIEAALAQLHRLRKRWPNHLPLIDHLEERYQHRVEHLPEEDDDGGLTLDPEHEAERVDHRAIRDALIAAEREAVIGLRDRHEISDEILRRLERELDLEELRLEADL
ncbi:MAG TPA: Na+/H+ antiporter [Candidatus Limnocylindrales bacterium]|nr:Na+/H+ antiporter [Candidatus Limnocylindrales bacterium]